MGHGDNTYLAWGRSVVSMSLRCRLMKATWYASALLHACTCKGRGGDTDTEGKERTERGKKEKSQHWYLSG
jgi:hypothetical protein